MTDKAIQGAGDKTIIRRPVYSYQKNNGKEYMKVRYYDGSKDQTAIFYNAGSTSKKLENCHLIAQDLTKFFNKNSFNKNGGKIPSEKMLLAWMETIGSYGPVLDEGGVNSDVLRKDFYNVEKIKILERMIQIACQDNSPGGSDVTQEEQFSIMKALGSWFIK